MKRLLLIIIALAVAAWVSHAEAKDEPAFYDDMNRMCSNTNVHSKTVFITSCYQYIRGFLQGAVITDTVIMQKVQADGFDSDFAQRAYRTRVGNLQDRISTSESIPATLFAGFCLPNEQVSHEVVVTLLDDVKQRFLQIDDGVPDNPLSEHLYELLKQRYPCDATVA